MLTLTQREARLGPKYAGKYHEPTDGAPEHKSLKIQLENIAIDETEFNALFQDPNAWRLLVEESGAPALALLREFELKGLALEGAHVVLWYSLGAQKIELKTAKLSKIGVHIGDAVTGETSLSLTVEGEPPLDASLVDLLERIGHDIEVEIRADHPAAQKDLPLNRAGEGEQPEERKRGANRGRKFTRNLN